MLDVVTTSFSDRAGYAIAAVNKDACEEHELTLDLDAAGEVCVHYLCGASTESYNVIGCENVSIERERLGAYRPGMQIRLRPHSVNIIWLGVEAASS